MEPDIEHLTAFIDLLFLNSRETNKRKTNQKETSYQKNAGLKVQTASRLPNVSEINPILMKPEIEIEFPAKKSIRPELLEIEKRIHTIRNNFGIKIFVFQSNAGAKSQTSYVNRIAELLAMQKKQKILLLSGLCQSQRVGKGKVTPIYQVLRKSEFVNLYSMSFEGYFSSEELAEQQKRVHELMQLFQISFDFILINQSLNRSGLIDTLLCESPFQRFRLHFKPSNQA